MVVPFACGQKPPVKFGDVSLEEITMRSYEKDTSAAAIILADYGISSIQYRQDVGFVVDFERITRIKIFTKQGLAYGNFTIPLSKDESADERLDLVKAVTYNLSGGKTVETSFCRLVCCRNNV